MYNLVILDDDVFVLEQFVSAFDWNKMGFKVVASFDLATDCLEYLKTHPVDAILTDIIMPDITGVQLAEQCSLHYPDIGIVFISAYSDFELARSAIRYNVLDYVLKPIDDDDLLRAIEQLKKFLDKKAAIGAASSAAPKKRLESSNPTIQKIFQYVEEHYGENIRTADIAAHVLLNPSYFGLFFKKHTGDIFTNYLRRFRMEKSCELLKNTDMKIAAVADHVNYKNTTHFYKHFSEEYHMTPAEYRKQYQHVNDGEKEQ